VADRVAIIGGSTPGRDHFPFPVEDIPVGVLTGDGTPYPFSLTAAEACHLVMCCKTFRLTSGAITYNPGPDTLPSVTSDLSVARSREAEVVISSGIEDSGAITQETGGSQTYVYFQPFLSLIQPDYGSGLAWDSQLWCGFRAGINIYESDDPDDPAPPFEFGLFTHDILEGGLSGGTLTFTTSLITKTVPLYRVGMDYSSDITLECIEYWPHATKDGSPVYDTATGAQLADPLS
jgi:hypothetical protein